MPFILWRSVMSKTLMAVAVAGAFALSVAAVASAGSDNLVVAQAGGGATSKSARFDALDRNHDGYLSRDEAKDAAELNTRFSELDTNNDGKLSREEYNALDAGKSGAAGATSGPQDVPGKDARQEALDQGGLQRR
jgi:hypothetical protein